MKKIIPLISILLLNLSVYSNNLNVETNYEIIVPDLDNPWSFVFITENSILITEKKGELIHFENGIKNTISGLPEIVDLGQGGLLDIELHPKYKKNGWIYITYASSNDERSGANTSLMRFKIKNNTITNKELLYSATPNSKKGQHFGSRILFDNNDNVYFSIGDRGNRNVNPQNIKRDGGKIYRLEDDGTIPIDNPFVMDRYSKKAIFSYGHRNPQGMAINPLTNELWIHEHGPKGGDEINIINSGKNYGWPLASYGVNYIGTKFTDKTSLSGTENPIHYWVPSIAPSGMIFVDSDKYPNWKNNLLIGSLKFEYLHMCVIKGNSIIKEEKLLEGIGRVRSLEMSPSGFIYVGVENLGIIKIIPN
ncbi:MAG: PQQ-dependent sugar dehydrogenase [Flavobacteriales bacterium]